MEPRLEQLCDQIQVHSEHVLELQRRRARARNPFGPVSVRPMAPAPSPAQTTRDPAPPSREPESMLSDQERRNVGRTIKDVANTFEHREPIPLSDRARVMAQLRSLLASLEQRLWKRSAGAD